MYKQSHRVHFDGDSFTYKLIILWFIVFKISTSPSTKGHVKTFIALEIFGKTFLSVKLDDQYPRYAILRYVYLFGKDIYVINR